MTAAVRGQVHITVSAPGTATAEELALAEAVGRHLAERGCTLVCGGLGGGMEAACRGAKAADGVTIGIIPGTDARDASPWVDHVICTGMGQARNVIVAASGQALIAVGGGWGTLSEIALALRLGRPVILLGGWTDALSNIEAQTQIRDLNNQVVEAKSPASAVDAAIAAIEK